MALACPDCGTVQTIPPLPRGAVAACPVCDNHLERTAGRSLDAALAFALSTLLLLAVANVQPLLTVKLAGVSRGSVIAAGVRILWDQAWALPAIQIAAFAIVFPFLRFGLLALVLGAIRLGFRPRWLGPAFRWGQHLDPWAMPDVFLVGCLVGYSRVAAFLPTRIGAGGWCLVAGALMALATGSALDARCVWRRIAPDAPWPSGPCVSCPACDFLLPMERQGGRCPRCAARLWPRRADSLIRTTALVIAGLLLYGPANFYPMTSTVQPNGIQHHTIFRGIQELIDADLWPLAVLVFCASIAIPLAKLVGLSWLVISVRRAGRFGLKARTRLHRGIDRIGRWSNIDVFTIAVFSPLMQFDGLVSANAGRGADAFLLVVVTTMLASITFDPRLMWDAAKGRT